MIIVNYFHEKGYNEELHGFELHLAAVVNDYFSIVDDPDLIQHAIINDDEFHPKDETLYEIQMYRAAVASDPVPEPAFMIHHVVEKTYDEEFRAWITPLVRI